jgi:hypothetical protein
MDTVFRSLLPQGRASLIANIAKIAKIANIDDVADAGDVATREQLPV